MIAPMDCVYHKNVKRETEVHTETNKMNSLCMRLSIHMYYAHVLCRCECKTSSGVNNIDVDFMLCAQQNAIGCSHS